MNNVVGTPARGANFFPRQREIEKLVNKLKNGNNLQIAAPRRVGKTSILFFLKDNAINDYLYVYVDTERIDNEQDFYKKLLKEILKHPAISKSGILKSMIETGAKWFKKVKSIKILNNEINLQEDHDLSYYEELTNFLSSFETESGKQLVLLIDEFPQTILNIVEVNRSNFNPAIKFLQSNRELRLNPEIIDKVKFIYTGSIGLNHTVASIDATAFINDLNSVEIDVLTEPEGLDFVKGLFSEKNIDIDEPVSKFLLHRIQWLIPFHIQLLVQEILDLSRESSNVNETIVDRAFENIVHWRNNNHFEHYYKRLKSQFKGQEFKYASELLETMAKQEQLNRSELYDLAVKFGVEESYRQIIEILVYDGYINNTNTHSLYRFNSPIVRVWWQKFICKN